MTIREQEVSQSVPLSSRSWMFSVLCTVSPSLLSMAWSKDVFPSVRRPQKSCFKINESINQSIF